MNLLPILAFLTIAGVATGQPAQSAGPAFVPWPQAVTRGDGGHVLTPANRVLATDARLAPLAQVLSDEIHLSTAVRLQPAVGAAKAGDIVLRINEAVTADEGYRVKVGPTGVEVEGKTYRGVAWGTVTLLQAIEHAGGKLRVPAMTIEDQPAASYRGLLIDVGRKWHPVESLRPIIGMCRLYKINYLQLHLNDNTEGNVMAFPFKSYPTLATARKGNRTTYTIEEITGLVKYADERGVTIVPELSGPGAHSGPLRSIIGRGNTIDCWNEKTYEVMNVLIGELCDAFKSSPWIHIGGDEGVFNHLGKSPEEQAYMEAKGVKNPLNYYIKRIDGIIKKHGKKTICWEGFHGDGGGLPKDILVMPYESTFNPANKLVKQGFSVINTAWKPLYVVGSRKWEPEYIYDSWNMRLWEHHMNTKCHIQLTQTDPVVGAQICAWEQAADVELPSTRTRIPAMSERIWNPELGQKYADYAPRAAKVDALLDLTLGVIPVKSEGLSGQEDRGFHLFEKPLTVTLFPLPIGTARYTVDGSDPTSSSPKYAKPFQITKADTHSEKLFYNRRVGRHAAVGDVVRVKVRMFDSADKPIGDVVTLHQYWCKSAGEAASEARNSQAPEQPSANPKKGKKGK
jgi:hexosaminidase